MNRKWYSDQLERNGVPDPDLERAAPDSPFLDDSYRAFETVELKKPVQERWKPPAGRRLAREFYGKYDGFTAFVIGTGPSISKAKSFLMEPKPNTVRICVNRAIEEVPGDFWFWIDADAYFKWRGHTNVPTAHTIGVDRFEPLYGPEVFVWERAFELEDIKAGRLVHRCSSLIPSMHFAAMLGCKRIVTIGTDNQLTGKEDPVLKDQHSFLFQRVNWSLRYDTKFWKPRGVELRDASWGSLELPRTRLNFEIQLAENIVDGMPGGAANDE